MIKNNVQDDFGYYTKYFPEIIETLRTISGNTSQMRFANTNNLSLQTINNLEQPHGPSNIKLSTLEKIAAHSGILLSALFFLIEQRFLPNEPHRLTKNHTDIRCLTIQNPAQIKTLPRPAARSLQLYWSVQSLWYTHGPEHITEEDTLRILALFKK